MKQEIKASFKQATVKAGTATLQFEVLPSAEGFTDVMRMAGEPVMLTVESEQPELPLDEFDGQTVINNNYYVSAETGEVYEPIEDEAYMLEEGGEEL